MSLRTLALLILIGAPHLALAQDQGDQGDEEEVDDVPEPAQVPGQHRDTSPGVPFYVPRGAFGGAYFNEGTITPQLRVQWQATLLQMQNDALVVYVEGGGGFGLALARNIGPGGVLTMRSSYQHLALIGLGYDAMYRNDFAWGFQLMTGPLWYGAAYKDDLIPAERVLNGTVEARVNAGLRVGDFRLMISGGWAQVYQTPRNVVSAPFTGGPIFGVYLNWRPVIRPK